MRLINTEPHDTQIAGVLDGMSAYGTKRLWIRRQSMSALPRFSDIDLFGNGKRIVHLDPEIADRTLDLRVA